MRLAYQFLQLLKDSDPIACEKLSNGNFTEGDRIMCELGISPQLRDLLLLNSGTINAEFTVIRRNIQNIIHARNELENNISDIHDHLQNLLHYSVETGDSESLLNNRRHWTDERFRTENLFSTSPEKKEEFEGTFIFQDQDESLFDDFLGDLN